jgi:hypothetical protein
LMPAIRLIGAGAVARKDFQDHIGAHRVRLLPAIRQAAALLATRAIDENHKTASDPQVTGIVAIVISNISQVARNFANGGSPLAFRLVIEGPAKGGAGRRLQQEWNAAVFEGARSPPRSNPHLDAGILHGGQMLLDEHQIR